ncbi:MAG: YegS/Rv2252/BmrU family lipid kinase [Bacilli bacterium]|jgi:YegS/Rv2252/BmrU family lipid kinase
MNAIFLYSNAPGSGRITKKVPYIEKRLTKIFKEVKILRVDTLLDFKQHTLEACHNFDVLVFAGGDGTFNYITNIIAKEEKRPTIGYIPSGTLNDFGKNFGINRNVAKSLDIIEKGKIKEFDIGLINNQIYFAFVAAIGTFSEISYATKRKRVRAFGKMAYYMNAVKDAVIPRSFDVEITIGNETYKHKVPFFLLLNSRFVGGFPVNLKNALDDGKFDVYLTKPGLFNGLVNYLFLKRRTAYYRVDKISISPDIQSPWCVDGEEGPRGDIEVVLLHKHLRIYTNK